MPPPDKAPDNRNNYFYVSPDTDLKGYYEQEKTGNEQFSVIDVYNRVENNSLQGLYFDKNTRSFYESTGLYG